MGKIYNIFSTREPAPKTHSLASANEALPAIRKYTEEAVRETDKLALQLQYVPRESPQFKTICKAYDEILMRWAERIHRLGAQAKGLWLVDFDTGDGYLCWSFPEERIEHFHTYDGGYKTRSKLQTQTPAHLTT